MADAHHFHYFNCTIQIHSTPRCFLSQIYIFATIWRKNALSSHHCEFFHFPFCIAALCWWKKWRKALFFFSFFFIFFVVVYVHRAELWHSMSTSNSVVCHIFKSPNTIRFSYQLYNIRNFKMTQCSAQACISHAMLLLLLLLRWLKGKRFFVIFIFPFEKLLFNWLLLYRLCICKSYHQAHWEKTFHLPFVSTSKGLYTFNNARYYVVYFVYHFFFSLQKVEIEFSLPFLSPGKLNSIQAKHQSFHW